MNWTKLHNEWENLLVEAKDIQTRATYLKDMEEMGIEVYDIEDEIL